MWCVARVRRGPGTKTGRTGRVWTRSLKGGLGSARAGPGLRVRTGDKFRGQKDGWSQPEVKQRIIRRQRGEDPLQKWRGWFCALVNALLSGSDATRPWNQARGPKQNLGSEDKIKTPNTTAQVPDKPADT